MRHSIIIRFILLITLTSLIWSCKKEPDLLGLDLIPENDLLDHAFTDTITIEAITVREDTLSTDELATSLLGSINDPVFGITKASIYTQIRVPVVPDSDGRLGINPVADSIILTIPYKGIYGSKNAIHHVRVYELDDTLNLNDKYYHFTTRPVKSELIGESTFIANLTDSVYIDTVKAPPLMRIPLSIGFANRLITSDSTTLVDKNFVKTFKGLYITVDDHATPASGAIMYLDFASTHSRIHVYYRKGQDTAREATKFSFYVNANCARFNNYEHNGYAGANPDLLSQLGGNKESAGERLFMQSMGGTKIKLAFPHLTDLATRKIAIHEASLMFESEDPDPEYPVSALVAVRSLKEDGEYDVLKDEKEEGAAYLDGYASKDNKYRLRITRYIQNRMINPDDPDFGLILIGAGSSLNANRTVIKGPEAGEGRMRLLIYYTPLD